MKKVLVVDDTKNIRMLLTTCLEAEGYFVRTSGNGLEALELFKNQKYDLAFLDIKLPELSGTEILRQIRSIGIEIPIVIMTGFATIKNAVECTKLGAVLYLQKPFTTEKLRALLNEIMSKNINEPSVSELIQLSRSLLDEGKIDEAYTHLKKILFTNPSVSEAYYLIGKVHERHGDMEKAQKFYKAAEDFSIK